MSKPFKLSLISDVRGFLKGTDSVEDALEKVADTLDDLADTGETSTKGVDKGLERVANGAKTTEKATERLERKFSDAVKDMAADAKTAGTRIGADLDAGAEKAEQGFDDLKDEAAQSARETAASFSGSFEDIGDLIQEIAAQAFQGFGPLGMAAGIAAAAGIGYMITSMQEGAEKAAEAKDKVIELAHALADVDGNPAALDWADRLKDTLTEIVDTKEWYEFWQNEPETRLEEWSAAVEQFGIDIKDMTRAASGDTEALARVQSILNAQYEQANRVVEEYAEATGGAARAVPPAVTQAKALTDSISALQTSIEEEAASVQQASQLHDQLAGALGGLNDIAAEAQDATTAYEEAVVAALNGAGQAWETYTTDGVVNLSQYNAAIEAQAAAVQRFEENLVAASADLSAEALNYIKALGPEAAPLLDAFLNAPLEEKQRTAANWNALGKAATDGYKQSARLDEATKSNVEKAQKIADGNPIRFTTELESTLQQEINYLAGTLRVPTITIPVQPQVKVD